MRKLMGLLLTFLFLPVCAGAQVVEYYHLDAVGNVRAVTDQQAQVIERHEYLPFGEEWNPQGGTQPLRFTGKERDAETGLDYFGARYYTAPVGRFTSVDPAYTWQENLVDPQRWNQYSYADNNPLRHIDPNGKNIFDVISGFANAYGSNFFLGYGRLEPNNPDNAFGQAFGDLASVHTGLQEFAAGAPLWLSEQRQPPGCALRRAGRGRWRRRRRARSWICDFRSPTLRKGRS